MVIMNHSQEFDGSKLTPENIQTVRLMLMMYRQGWIDAANHLMVESNNVARKIKEEYKELL